MLLQSNQKTYDFIKLYQQFIKDSLRGKRLQPNGKRISEGTINTYRGTLRLIERFIVESNFELRISEVTKFNTRKLHFEKNYWAKFYKKFTDYLYDKCGHYDNYVGLTIKNIKTFFGYLNKTLLIVTGGFHNQLYVRKETISIVTLLPEELNFLIYNSEFENSLPDYLKKVKDIFVFGCTVALRYSDLMNLKKTNVKINGNEIYLFSKSIKTQCETIIKLPDYIIAILKKYKSQKGNWLLPRYNNVILNKYIKRLAERAGFTNEIYKARDKRGLENEIIIKSHSKLKHYRFCDLITTHTMRRTAITTMLCLGMPEHIVRKISGHAPGSKEFYRYVSLAQHYQDKETEIMFSKLKDSKFTTL